MNYELTNSGLFFVGENDITGRYNKKHSGNVRKKTDTNKASLAAEAYFKIIFQSSRR